MKVIRRNRSQMNLSMRHFMLSYGFVLVVVLVFIGFSLSTGSFLTLGNLIDMMHAVVPMLILASGLALVIMTGNIDISVR